MDEKPIGSSKTIVVNVLTVVLLIINQFAGVIPAEYGNAVALAVAVINTVLRFYTTQPVTSLFGRS